MGSSGFCVIFYLHATEVFVFIVIFITWHHEVCMANTDELAETFPETWLKFSEDSPCRGDYSDDGKVRVICSAAEKTFEFDQLPIETAILEIHCKGSELNATNLSLYRLEELTLDMCFNLHLDDVFQSTPEIRKLSIKATYDILDFPRILTVISSLNKLQFLSLSKSSGFERLRREDLAILKPTSLEELDVSGCHIEAVDRDAFDDLNLLRSFDFSSNPLSEKAVGNITASLKGRKVDRLALKHLYRIKQDLPLNSLMPLKQSFIQNLDLSDNSIPRLPAKSFSYAHLKTLKLSNSKISYISPSAFQGALLLETMDLRGNALASIDDQLSHVTSLRVIDLSTQDLDGETDEKFSITENSFANLTNLEILSLNEAPFYGNLTRFMFNGLVSLEKLELRQSNIKTIDDFTFETMESLRILDLSFNDIKELNSNVFYGLEKLIKLNLKRNSLTFEKSDANLNSDSIPFAHLRSLQVLDLQNNYIKHLHPDILNPLNELQFLSIKHNRLKSWDAVAFPRQNVIRELLLSHNDIQTVSNAMLQDFANLGNLQNLDLSENPFNCTGCDLQIFLKWAAKTNLKNHQNFQSYKCVAPTQYEGMRINNTLLSEHCEPTTVIPESSTVSEFSKVHIQKITNTDISWSIPVYISLFALLTFGLTVFVYYIHVARRHKMAVDSKNPETALHF